MKNLKIKSISDIEVPIKEIDEPMVIIDIGFNTFEILRKSLYQLLRSIQYKSVTLCLPDEDLLQKLLLNFEKIFHQIRLYKCTSRQKYLCQQNELYRLRFLANGIVLYYEILVSLGRKSLMSSKPFQNTYSIKLHT